LGNPPSMERLTGMPLLPAQADTFPPDLLDDPPRHAAPGAGWVAFYTLARREKDLMRKMEAAGLPFYGPVVRRRLRSAGGRVRWSQVPLFAGYVFGFVDDDQRRAALATNTIARCLPVTDSEALLADLRMIHRLVASEQPLTPEARLESGHPVRIRSGRGLEGTVVSRKGRERLVVAIRFINQGASIELEDVDLERI